jgi:hypothetical protein
VNELACDTAEAVTTAYRNAVKRLTAENLRLRETLRVEETKHCAEVNALTAQLAEGLTPELLVLRREVRRWRDRALAAEARGKEKNR